MINKADNILPVVPNLTQMIITTYYQRVQII